MTDNYSTRRQHWNKIYETKDTSKVSWYQPLPEMSLRIISESDLPASASIIDIGGGDSMLACHLLEIGFKDISVLDISSSAIEKAARNMEKNAQQIKWIVSDITEFQPPEEFDFWHDRAAFHFLINDADINKYVDTARKGIKPGGFLFVGTFSEIGPETCSGLPVSRYSESGMEARFASDFKKLKCVNELHITPSGKQQHFIYCLFRRK